MRSSPSWFRLLFGFDEYVRSSPNFLRTKSEFTVTRVSEESFLISKKNGRSFPIGVFSTPSVAELRTAGAAAVCSPGPAPSAGTSRYDHQIVIDILALHGENPGATFQAASQFNCLEFPNEDVTPEDGVTQYGTDRTQGPACALACAAGTVFRNYFCTMNGMEEQGQTAESQLNNLDGLELLLRQNQEGEGDDPVNYFTIRNGYSFSSDASLQALNEVLPPPRNTADNDSAYGVGIFTRDAFLASIKIGVHSNVGVTFSDRFTVLDRDIRVTQCYCSALSCAYSGLPLNLWEPLARLVLDANYEAAVWAAAINRHRGGSRDLFLTFLGGGVFGNDKAWIADAIGRALAVAYTHNLGLDVHVMHYRSIDEEMKNLVDTAFESEMARLTNASS